MKSSLFSGVAATLCLVACSPETGPTGPSPSAAALATGDQATQGTEPHYSLDVVLMGQANASGTIKFRQPVDDEVIANLDTRVENLGPNTAYRLQRAADAPDGVCTSTAWLTLGNLLVAKVLTTNASGTGEARFRRDLTAALGGTFDIQFRIIDATTAAVAVQSECYQFTVRR